MMYIKIFNYIFFLSAMSFRSHFKDSNFPSFCLETKSWQTHQFLPYSNNLADFINENKKNLSQEFLPKNPPQKILPKNPTKIILAKKFSQRITPKKFHQKKSSKKILQKNSPKI